ncbi:hypothetical protein SAMN05421543_12112 [Alicyclobacillus macrosporangiidus]|uniref:Uncharacterized protein n=1 Tax=Alicyclobacillus macrosporangiidus TaxID=392015 RepID=A0A1I7KY64_9BACL|nr:hypothetical protein SAMN05421543_12112 [Alicyclobacillus macrosporangiidus]
MYRLERDGAALSTHSMVDRLEAWLHFLSCGLRTGWVDECAPVSVAL